MSRVSKVVMLAFACVLVVGLFAGCSGNKQSGIEIDVTADGWNSASSTPAIAHVVSDDGKTDIYHVVNPGEKTTVEVESGGYSVTIVSPVNADGSIYATDAAQAASVEKGKTTSLSFKLVPITAADATAEQLEQAVKAIAAAVAAGDDSLSGEKGKSILEQAKTNVAAAGKVDADELDAVEVGQAAGQQQSSGDSGASRGGDVSGHTHTWATRTVSDGQVWVVDEPGWSEQVIVGSHYHCSCGNDFYSDADLIEHKKQAHCTSSVVTDYETVWHDEEGHYEDRSHTETYCTSCGAVQ